RIEVERLPLDEAGQRVRARSDRLGLERLGGPAVGHLPRDHALDVALERDDVHHTEEPGLRDELELATVEATVERERRLLGGPKYERLGRRSQAAGFGRYEEIGANRDRSLWEPIRGPRRVDGDEGEARRDRHCATTFGKKNPYLLPARFPQLCPGVVVSQDLVVGAAGESLAVRAVLTHPDAVPVAASGDEEDSFAVARGWRLLSRRGCDGDGQDEDGCGDECAHEGSRVAPHRLKIVRCGQTWV